MQRQVKKIFVDNNKIGFSPQNWWAATTCKAKTVYINRDEIILNFCRKEIMRLPDEIEYNRIGR